MTGQLSALAGLGALRHLDLDIVRVDEVLGGHTKTARGDLLDRRTLGIHGTVGQRQEALWLLPSLAGVRLATKDVHGPRQRGVRFVGNAAKGHGARRETLDDLLRRLHFLERHRVVGPFEIHEPAQCQEPFALLVDELRELPVGTRIVCPHSVLQPGDAFRGPVVRLATQAIGIVATDIEMLLENLLLAVGITVPAHGLGSNLVQADTLDGRRCACEELPDKARREAHGIENLRAAIGLVGRDAHLGHDLLEALADRLDVAVTCGPVINLVRQIVEQCLDGLEDEPGVDRLGAVTGQGCKMMHLECCTGLDHETGFRAQPLADKVMMHGRGGQQRRNRDIVGVHTAV